MGSLENYYNKVTNDGRIFSFEDVLNIPREEDAFYRKAINYQYGEIGFPRDEELRNSRDVVYVRAYTRDDGTPVRAHYRSKNGHNYTNPNKPVLGTPKETKAKIDAMVDKWMDSWKEPETKTLKGGINYDNNTDDYSKIEEIKGIKEKYAQEREEIERERILGHLKDYGGAALEIGSAFVPGVGVPKMTAQIAAKLAPKFGKRIANEIASGIVSGGLSGTIGGAGHAMMNDENVIGGAVKGGVSGAAGGGLTGTAAGYAGRSIDGFGLTHHKPFEMMTKGEYNQYGRNGKKYYKDYIQYTKVKNDILGDIYFSGGQAGKPDYKYMEQYPALKRNIRKSIENINLPNNKIREDSLGFDNLKVNWNGQDYAYQIRNNSYAQNKDFYNIKPYEKLIKNQNK